MPAFSFQHLWEHQTRQNHCSGKINGENLVDLRFAQFVVVRIELDTRIVYEDVYWADLISHTIHKIATLLRITKVGQKLVHITPEFSEH